SLAGFHPEDDVAEAFDAESAGPFHKRTASAVSAASGASSPTSAFAFPAVTIVAVASTAFFAGFAFNRALTRREDVHTYAQLL
ncbi:unnamed protein product, partial [Symbiodinium pilosum]